MQEAKPCDIQQKKENLKRSWEFQQEYMLQMMNDAMSWKCSSEQYNCLVRDYYIAREKHQKEVMRLNQILYYSENASVPFSRGDQMMSDTMYTDRVPLQNKNGFSCQDAPGCMIDPACKKRGREDEWNHQHASVDKRLHAASR